MPVPIQFSYHTWIVTEQEDQKDRYDVFGFAHDGFWGRTGHVHQNYHAPAYGCPRVAFGSRAIMHDRFRWDAVRLFELTDSQYPKVPEIIKLLQNNPEDYPYWNTYSLLPGPNSNTFVQWVLDTATDGALKLPWGAWGKGYKSN